MLKFWGTPQGRYAVWLSIGWIPWSKWGAVTGLTALVPLKVWVVQSDDLTAGCSSVQKKKRVSQKIIKWKHPLGVECENRFPLFVINGASAESWGIEYSNLGCAFACESWWCYICNQRLCQSIQPQHRRRKGRIQKSRSLRIKILQLSMFGRIVYLSIKILGLRSRYCVRIGRIFSGVLANIQKPPIG